MSARPLEAASLTLRASGATDVGRQRTGNEDRFHVDAARGIFIVVDGIGGHAAGDVAADTAIAAMLERLNRETGAVSDRIREAITIANNEIHRLAGTRADWRGMACVLTAVVMDGDRAVVGHVGDSRLYRIDNGEIVKITPDHSPVGEREDAREISEADAMRHPRRNEVFRDVGSEPHQATDPDFVFVGETLLPARGGLLLCSDGLSDLVPSARIAEIVMAHAGTPDMVTRTLIAAANEAGGKDNITVIYMTRGGAAALAGPLVETATPTSEPARVTTSAFVLCLVAATLVGFGAGWVARPGDWRGGASAVLGTVPATTVVVRAGESIAAAVAQAQPGTDIIVEPGEYREQISLGSHIRIVSRVPRGAVIRLPDTAGEADAAVVASGVVNAEFSGFRIVGDAAMPLGSGVLTHDANVRLVDLEVTGARTSAITLGTGDDVSLSGSDIHDNPGMALTIAPEATPRISNNTFARNGGATRAPVTATVAAGSAPVWQHNVFTGVVPATVAGLDVAARSILVKDNWFVASPAAPVGAARGGRGAPASQPSGRGR